MSVATARAWRRPRRRCLSLASDPWMAGHVPRHDKAMSFGQVVSVERHAAIIESVVKREGLGTYCSMTPAAVPDAVGALAVRAAIERAMYLV